MDRPSAEALDALLPQTQCTRCGYAGCRPYAEAMAAGEAAPNRCPPGGPSTLAALSAALRVPAEPLDPACGDFGAPQVALIDEAACIGCAKCLPACPVDAILGARKFMHTVITADCNGCALCIAPCPVDCITLVPTGAPALSADQVAADATRYRARYVAHRARGEQREARRTAALATRAERLRTLSGDLPKATP